MTKFTKEQLQEIIETDHVQCGEASELARIALASLEAEAVCVIDQSNLDYLKSGSDADVWPASRTEMGDVLLYLSAPPAPVSVPDEVTAEDCPAFVKYDVTDVDEAWARGFNACRAAMLQGADGNSPVIPDGWKLVPIDPTKDMLRAGQSVVGFWLNTVHCYSKMLAAAPAAPQQEVTQALAKGMERYGDAMRELAKKEEK